ncbi:MAG: sulfotransferase family 2 domain-containing protein [Bryobacteraceae bacterium]
MNITVPVVRTRYVIVHYHIFKNGGSTVEYVLAREFTERFATVHGGDPDATLDAADLIEFLRQYPDIAAVSSHHLRYPKPLSRQTVFFDCCFLRDPLARLYSTYHHFRRSDSDLVLARWARSYGPREFAMRLIDEAPHQVSDVQVMQLANGGAFTRPADEKDLERAVAVVREMAVPGLVEMFDESLAIAEYFLRPAFPTLRLEYVPQNVGDAAGYATEPSREYWEGVWGEALCGRLLRMNEMDLELVRRTKSEIQRRLARVPRAAERIADLQSRCARLASAFGGQVGAPIALPAVSAAEGVRSRVAGL